MLGASITESQREFHRAHQQRLVDLVVSDVGAVCHQNGTSSFMSSPLPATRLGGALSDLPSSIVRTPP